MEWPYMEGEEIPQAKLGDCILWESPRLGDIDQSSIVIPCLAASSKICFWSSPTPKSKSHRFLWASRWLWMTWSLIAISNWSSVLNIPCIYWSTTTFWGTLVTDGRLSKKAAWLMLIKLLIVGVWHTSFHKGTHQYLDLKRHISWGSTCTIIFSYNSRVTNMQRTYHGHINLAA